MVAVDAKGSPELCCSLAGTQVHVHGDLASPNCGLSLHLNATSIFWEVCQSQITLLCCNYEGQPRRCTHVPLHPYAMCHAQSALHHAPCAVALCAMCHVQRALHHAPCAIAPCVVHHTPCTMCCTPCAMCHCTMCRAPCAVHHVPYTLRAGAMAHGAITHGA